MKLIYFPDISVFSCRCGCGSLPKEELMQAADKLRMAFGSPLVVTSGYRCPTHNQKVGGAARSKHMAGEAVDLVPTKKPISELHKFIEKEAAALGLWYESPIDAPSWLHIQVVPYPSWKEGMPRVFRAK